MLLSVNFWDLKEINKQLINAGLCNQTPWHTDIPVQLSEQLHIELSSLRQAACLEWLNYFQ